ncbi:MAG: MFS transporter [Alphaproteobacteria bacterium]|nr:MFS transporter [Alphaproteobacteria bacterium]OJV14128.1 MAG: hypothetical protein BGO27_01410 [Alphaproteobacteria bacterium 33-17]
MLLKFKKNYLPAMLGAAIEYYDVALYGFMAPILVKVFFPYITKSKAYFIYFFIEFIAALFQVCGAKIFGYVGDKYGRKPAMYYSMLGTSLVTFIVSMLPTYNDIGIVATIAFVLSRLLQSFFLGGEYNGGAIYCLEHTKNNKGFISGIYCSFTVLGIVVASFVAYLISKFGAEYFRYAYYLSFILAILTVFMRKDIKETPEYKAKPNSNSKLIFIYDICLASMYFGILYGLPSKILSVILPLHSGISQSHIMLINALSLIIYMICLSIFGYISDKIGFKKQMRIAVIFTVILIYPLTMMLSIKSLIIVLVVKTIFMLMAALYIAPFHAYAQDLSQSISRYKSISVSYTTGKCASTLLLSGTILLYEFFISIIAPVSILFLLSILILNRYRYEKS